MKEACTIEPISLLEGERRTYSGVLQPFPEHAHGHYVFGVVREGERVLRLNGEGMHIGPGDVLVFNPGDAHGCMQDGEAPFAYDSITVGAAVLGGKRFRTPSETDTPLRKRFGNVLRLLDGHCESEALEALSCFVQSLGEASGPHLRTARHEEAAFRLHARIMGRVADPVALGEFAETEGITPYALIRAYRRVFSIAPVRHQLALRVDSACSLLSKGANPADAAAELGFADQAHLTREFKKRIGCTPAAYRAMHGRGAGRV